MTVKLYRKKKIYIYISFNLRLESFTSVNVKVCVVRNNMPCSLVDKYQLPVRACCFHLLPCRGKQEVVSITLLLICEPTWGHTPQGSNLLVAAESQHD